MTEGVVCRSRSRWSRRRHSHRSAGLGLGDHRVQLPPAWAGLPVPAMPLHFGPQRKTLPQPVGPLGLEWRLVRPDAGHWRKKGSGLAGWEVGRAMTARRMNTWTYRWPYPIGWAARWMGGDHICRRPGQRAIEAVLPAESLLVAFWSLVVGRLVTLMPAGGRFDNASTRTISRCRAAVPGVSAFARAVASSSGSASFWRFQHRPHALFELVMEGDAY